MAKIPYQGLPEVAPSGQGAPMPHQAEVSGYDALTRGAQQFGQGLGSQLEGAAKEYDRRVEESRKKALEAEVTEGETEWNTHRTAKKYGRRSSGSASQDAGDAAFEGDAVEQQGYFNMQGDDAFKAGPGTFDSIEKKRKEIADNMSDKDARELFLKRTAPDVDNDRQQIEAFAGKQRQVADIATLKAREEAALEAIRANPSDFVEVSRQIAALDEPTRKLGLSEADKQDRVNDWRRRAGVAQVLGQLKGPDGWQLAEKTLESKRATIGGEAAAKLDELVNKAKGGADAQAVASTLLTRSLRSDGSVNERKLLDEMQSVPADRRDKVNEALSPLRLQARQAYDAETSRLLSHAQAAFNLKGWNGMPEQLKEQLNNRSDDPRGPQLYQALKHHDELELDRLERKSRIRANDAAARREQAEIDKIASNQWETALRTDPDADLKFFTTTHGGLSDHMPSELEKMQAKAKAVRDKGLTTSQNEFAQRALNEANGYLRNIAGTAKERAQAAIEREAFKTQAARAYQRFVIKEKREPSDAEAAEMIAKQIGDSALVPRTDEASIREGVRLTNRGMPKAAPSGKVEVEGPDGKAWRVDADGLDKWLTSHPGWKKH